MNSQSTASLGSAATAPDRHSLCVARTTVREKIWIDLDNSPHVPFFKPIAAELERRGYSVVFTARDCFQVRELADLMKLNYRCIGHHYGKHMVAKVAGIVVRALQLLPHVLRQRPHLAVSHGSRSMFALASILRIPTITIVDYEHTRWMWFLGKAWAMLPDVIPETALKLRKDRILRYPGIKEDVYAPFFRPNPAIKRILGITDQELVVTLRPPATEAHYHNPESEILFAHFMKRAMQAPDARIVLLPRNQKQKQWIMKEWPEWFAGNKTIIPGTAVDGLNLLWHSDLVVSGGGTMNREAAAIGVPVYSIFRGPIGAVDRYLQREGRLILVESVADVDRKIALTRRNRNLQAYSNGNQSMARIIEHLEDMLAAKRPA